jgi:hypothetical protein
MLKMTLYVRDNSLLADVGGRAVIGFRHGLDDIQGIAEVVFNMLHSSKRGSGDRREYNGNGGTAGD